MLNEISSQKNSSENEISTFLKEKYGIEAMYQLSNYVVLNQVVGDNLRAYPTVISKSRKRFLGDFESSRSYVVGDKYQSGVIRDLLGNIILYIDKKRFKELGLKISSAMEVFSNDRVYLWGRRLLDKEINASGESERLLAIEKISELSIPDNMAIYFFGVIEEPTIGSQNNLFVLDFDPNGSNSQAKMETAHWLMQFDKSKGGTT